MLEQDVFFSTQPPCQNACPLRMNVRGYINSIARGEYSEALKLIREDNPLPSVCGRVCHHPCELHCRRGYYDNPLAIKDLKRFASDVVSGDEEKIGPDFTERIAVVGGGPAGLTAAWQLLKLGYPVTLFEKEEKPGGVLSFGIPEYRLPLDNLLKDVDELTKMGVEIRYEQALGQDISLDQLKTEYASVVLALGLPLSRSLNIPGIELKGIALALPFLKACRLGEDIELGEKVVVIGGGNVAFDVARSAVRKGVKEVMLACLESPDEMPAFPWEIEEAKEEGVAIHCSWGPSKIIERNGAAGGVEFVQCTRVFDENGRFNPQLCEEVKFSLEGDTIIIAVGQAQDRQLLESLGLPFDERGRLVANTESMAVDEKIYICGETLLGPSTVSESMASGRRVAFSINAAFKGEKLTWTEQAPYPKTALISLELRAPKKERVAMPMQVAEVRKTNFTEIEEGYQVETALLEAKRCLTCLEEVSLDREECVSCMTCVRVCPFSVPEVKGGYPEIDWARCSGCGVCFSECPVFALSFTKNWEEAFTRQVIETAEQNKGRVRLACDLVSLDQKEAVVTAPCLARLSTLFYLKALEKGVQKLEVTTCSNEDCRNGEHERIVQGKLARAAGLLSETGQADRLIIIETGES